MKKAILSLAMFTLLAVCGANAQVRYVYDPFVNGDKYIGLEAGLGGWFGSADLRLNVDSYNTSSPYLGYTADKYKRSPLNPSIALLYKRVLEGNRISWGNNFRVALNFWHGTVEGTSITNPANTFTTTFNFKTAELTELYYAMIPVGDNLSINAGLGLTIGLNLTPKSTIEYSNGTPAVNTQGGTDFMDMMMAMIDVMVGVDYRVTDAITLSCNLLGYPIDFFGLFNDEGNKGLRGVGEGLYVSKRFPYHLTFGFTYSL